MASNSDHSERIRCAFCNEDFFQGNDIKEHLMSCGNKTDPCPTCGKRIRRAVFTYHYENNCANTDELDDTTPRLPRKVRTERVTKPDCPYCKLEFEADTIEEHFRRCDKNPDREPVRPVTVTYTGNQQSDNARTEQRYDSSNYTSALAIDERPEVEETTLFTCPYCKSFYDSRVYMQHINSCPFRLVLTPVNQPINRSRPWTCLQCGTTWTTKENWDWCQNLHYSASTYRTEARVNLRTPQNDNRRPWR